MKTKHLLQTVGLILATAFSLQPSALLAQGSLTPPGAPVAGMKTLAQIEPRTAISSAPFTISAPGSYYLTTNLIVSTGNAIIIGTNDVSLDLNGFTISSIAPSATGSGILINSGLSDLTICNGHIRGGVTRNGGTYSGSGFQNGIYLAGLVPANARVTGVSVMGCLSAGIWLGTADLTVVDSCTVRTVGGYGIGAATIRTSVVMDCGGTAIYGETVTDSQGESSGSGYGIYASTAQNCYGYSQSSHGLNASFSALNCYGSSGGGGYGLSANTAQNCCGFSSAFHGIQTDNAQNCYGVSSSSGYGLYVSQTAQNCFGTSSTGTGLFATVANTCVGYRSGGTAIQAVIGIGCYATGGTNNITYKYNMP